MCTKERGITTFQKLLILFVYQNNAKGKLSFYSEHRHNVMTFNGSSNVVWWYNTLNQPLRAKYSRSHQFNIHLFFISLIQGIIAHGPLTRYIKLCAVHAPEVPECFPRHRLQRKPLVRHPGMHPGTGVTHVPWCMSGSLNPGGGENVPAIPCACANRYFTYLARARWSWFPISLTSETNSS